VSNADVTVTERLEGGAGPCQRGTRLSEEDAASPSQLDSASDSTEHFDLMTRLQGSDCVTCRGLRKDPRWAAPVELDLMLSGIKNVIWASSYAYD
jgi:hypothetical protein